MQKPFEIGPIRPPSEANSLLLRVTRNCPWNKCRFCNLYRDHKFSTRPIEDIKADIDQVVLIRDKLLKGVPEDFYNLSDEVLERYFHIKQWVYGGQESVFLQDANTMVLSFNKLLEILNYLREKLPHVKRVTTYGRVDSLNKFSLEQLEELKKAGLNRIHSGFESGSDRVLTLINKGYKKAQEIESGQKVKASGIELSVYYMPGVGGKNLSDENAIETADVVNIVNPDFLRIRTFIARKGSEYYDDIDSERIKECTDKEKMLELKRMIENINGADGYLYSDHIINLFDNVNGNMHTDKEKMLSVFNDFMNLDPEEQRFYQIARRMGAIGSLNHLPLLSPDQKKKISECLSQLDNDNDFEAFLSRLLRRYI